MFSENSKVRSFPFFMDIHCVTG